MLVGSACVQVGTCRCTRGCPDGVVLKQLDSALLASEMEPDPICPKSKRGLRLSGNSTASPVTGAELRRKWNPTPFSEGSGGGTLSFAHKARTHTAEPEPGRRENSTLTPVVDSRDHGSPRENRLWTPVV